MPPRFAPALVIFHDERGRMAADRARALRSGEASTITCAEAASFDPEQLRHALEDVGAKDEFLLIHLVGDLDHEAAGTPDGPALARIAEEIEVIAAGIKATYPAVKLHQWVLEGVGADLGEHEIGLARELLRAGSGSLRGVLVACGSSNVSVSQRHDEQAAMCADLAHLLTTSELEPALSDADVPVWAVGVSSIAYRPARLKLGRLSESIRHDIEGSWLSAPGPDDPSAQEGRREATELLASPGARGDTRHGDDGERQLLLRSPGGGHLQGTIDEWLRAHELDDSMVPPGRWPELIEARVVDARRHALQPAIDRIGWNGDARTDELARQIEHRARRYLQDLQNVEASIRFCESMREQLTSDREALEAEALDEPSDVLEQDLTGLRQAVKWLPSGASTIVRLIVVAVLLLAVVVAHNPIPRLVAWVFDRQLPDLSDDPVENARRWARVTVALFVVGAGGWYSMRWRRAYRFRAALVRHVRQAFFDALEHRVLLERVRLRQRLELSIGGRGDGPAGVDTVIGFLERWHGALVQLGAGVLGDRYTAEDDLHPTRFALALPPPESTDISRFGDTGITGSEERLRTRLRELVLDARRTSSQRDLMEQLVSALEGLFEDTPRDLAKFLERSSSSLERSAQVLALDHTPVLEAVLTERAEIRHYLVGPETGLRQTIGEGLDEAGAEFGGVVAWLGGRDPRFLASVHLYSLRAVISSPAERGRRPESGTSPRKRRASRSTARIGDGEQDAQAPSGHQAGGL